MSDHHNSHASYENDSSFDNLHKSVNGITTTKPFINETILRHSAPSVLSQSRYALFSAKLRESCDVPHHPRRNYGLPHLER